MNYSNVDGGPSISAVEFPKDDLKFPNVTFLLNGENIATTSSMDDTESCDFPSINNHKKGDKIEWKGSLACLCRDYWKQSKDVGKFSLPAIERPQYFSLINTQNLRNHGKTNYIFK